MDESTRKTIVYDIKRYWASQGLTMVAAAAKMGISGQALNNMITRPFKSKGAALLCAFYPFNYNYIMEGEGVLLKDGAEVLPGKSEPEAPASLDPMQVLLETLKRQSETIAEQAKSINDLQDTVRSQQYTIRSLTEKVGGSTSAPVQKREVFVRK